MTEVTRILSRIEVGDPSAADELLPLVYDELLKPLGINDAGKIFGVTSNGTGLDRQVFVLSPN